MTTSKLNIAVFDDEIGTRTKFHKKLTSILPSNKFEVIALDPNQFASELEIIALRQSNFRDQGNWQEIRHNIFDDISILILDYDLFETQRFLKASEIAYLIRCFTTCGLILIANETSHNPFDLTLKGQLNSFADLHIGQDQLDSPFLWGLKRPDRRLQIPDSFYPWHWPDLPNYFLSYQKRIHDVLSAIKKKLPIEKVLGFDPGTFDLMPRNISQFLGEDPSKATFTTFVMSENGLELKDRKLKKGVQPDAKIAARIAAARIAKWLEYSVLPEQDILADAPHIVSRLPGLLSGNSKKISSWNDTAVRGQTTELGINSKPIEKLRFKKSHWISRPVWFWRKVMEYKNIEDVRQPWNIDYPTWVFCEDASVFSIDFKEFVSKAQSSYSRRYLKYFDSVEYEPRNRLSL